MPDNQKVNEEDFANRLGASLGGRIDDNGHWECADCDASGYEVIAKEGCHNGGHGAEWGLALYRHRLMEHANG